MRVYAATTGEILGNLTTFRDQRKIDLMFPRRIAICFSLALVATLVTSALASCMAGPAMSADAEMACCMAGHSECGMSGTAEQCCKTDSQTHELIVAKQELVRSPLMALSLMRAIHPGVPMTVPTGLLVRAPSPDALRTPSPPTYLLTSVLLI